MPRRADGNQTVYIEGVECDRETEKAIRVQISGDDYWVPKSCVTEDSEVTKKGDDGTLAIKRWFAEKESLV